ncbi:thioesterase family protein [Henriciella sp.]|uniref:thioesterase family protein n=1 Tax=Henriciella sp. TaxID=1968823 RepID=UPI0026195B1C|nr:thioesterase family protein [Henriciella sp.]
MNLFLRLVLTFIRASLSKKKAGILDTTRIRSRVMLTDQDMFAHMTNSRYFSFSDLAIINYIIRTGAWKKLRKRGWFPVVCSEIAVFGGMLSAHQAFEVATRLVGWTDTYLCLEHRFLRNGRETARVRLVARFASRGKEKVTVADVVDLLGLTEESPPLSEEFHAMIADVQAARARRREPSTAA